MTRLEAANFGVAWVSGRLAIVTDRLWKGLGFSMARSQRVPHFGRASSRIRMPGRLSDKGFR